MQTTTIIFCLTMTDERLKTCKIFIIFEVDFPIPPLLRADRFIAPVKVSIVNIFDENKILDRRSAYKNFRIRSSGSHSCLQRGSCWFDSQSGQNLIPSWQRFANTATVDVSGFVIRPRFCDC